MAAPSAPQRPQYNGEQAPRPGQGGFDGLLDIIHRLVVRVDQGINKVIPEEFNPFYYLGGVTNLLWVVTLLSGIVIWTYYTPSEDQAYSSVRYLTEVVPFGAMFRAVHRYAADGMFILAILHMFRNYFTDRYRGFRDLPWVSGVVLLLLTGFIGLTGYLLVWDQRAVVVTEAMIAVLKSLDGVIAGLGTWLARAFLGGDAVNNLSLSRMFFLHASLAGTIFFFLWMHSIHLHRPKIWPPAFVTLITLGVVLVASGLAPVETLPAANVAITAGTQLPFDIFFLWPVIAIGSLNPALILGILAILSAVLFVAPWLPKRPRYHNVATVTPENCTGCQLCAVDCPFDAIVMVPGANPDPKRGELAVVNDDKCAECGICVGACPFHAINLPLAHEDNVKDKVVALLS
jgi:ferredoxin